MIIGAMPRQVNKILILSFPREGNLKFRRFPIKDFGNDTVAANLMDSYVINPK